jgi:hypothetical protein
MIGKILIQAIIIGLLSTGAYGIFTRQTNDPYQRGPDSQTKTREYWCIGGIVTVVASVLLMMTTGSSDALVSTQSVESPAMNYKPPF